MHLAPHTAAYAPTSDAMDRHEYGVTKNRKAASTGGGRAWSEDETRLQKMPYKHIAAHLKKTELACRLHYHQLSHGSNRRKQRTTSVSSANDAYSNPGVDSSLRVSPGRSTSYAPVSPAPMQLPSIMGNGASPRLPAILPKPSMSGSLPMTPPLRLECALPPPQPPVNHHHVDMNRLQSVYTAHRASFWAAVANDYGPGASPVLLEQAWKSGACCSQHQANTPITPTSSPDNTDRDGYDKPQDKTRISAILGIDANPRSPRERELVRRMEEQRVGA
ncbi:hypothetical protein ColKHC_05044 [Colletotrichum higginsianum]|nr:hypothetical protein ColKHC_05044 [Colletotrichum higginsianum]